MHLVYVYTSLLLPHLSSSLTNFLTPPKPLIIPHRLLGFLPGISYATQKLMLVSCMMLQKPSETFHTFL